MDKTTLEAYSNRVNQQLTSATDLLQTHSATFKQAIQYSLLNGGKRLRPILVYITGECFGADKSSLDSAASAVEMIHCYSLIHDDLPAMDNANLRRGKPTCHKAFDEAIAILAGDAMQPLAFELLAKDKNLSDNNKINMVLTLAEASGAEGMADGQALDILANDTLSPEMIETLYNRKTGKLIEASIKLGAIAANCKDQQQIQSLEKFAKAIGLAFQIYDDLLDIEGEEISMGKDKGIDQDNSKNTYPIAFGIEESKQKIQQLLQSALACLDNIGRPTDSLADLAKLMVSHTPTA